MDRKERAQAVRRRLATLDRINHDSEAWWEPVEPEDPHHGADLPEWAGLQPVAVGWTPVKPDEPGGWFHTSDTEETRGDPMTQPTQQPSDNRDLAALIATANENPGKTITAYTDADRAALAKLADQRRREADKLAAAAQTPAIVEERTAP